MRVHGLPLPGSVQGRRMRPVGLFFLRWGRAGADPEKDLPPSPLLRGERRQREDTEGNLKVRRNTENLCRRFSVMAHA